MKLTHAGLIILLLALVSPRAEAGEAVVGSEVTVDVTGKDAADAKTTARAQAEGEALASLLNKLAPPEQVKDILASMDARKISAMVRGTQVLDEKISDNRYRAQLQVNFDADAVSDLISKVTGAGGVAATVTSSSYLIIASYEENGTVLMWEEKNPWRNVWKMVGLENTSGDVVVPYGDNTDLAVVDTDTLSSANFAALSPLTIRYGVSDVVILQAKYSNVPDMTLTVVKRQINRLQNEVSAQTYRADPQETKETLMIRAAHDIVGALQNKKVEEQANVKIGGVAGGEHSRMVMLATLTTLTSWIDIRARLAALPMIDRLELLAMSPQQVDMVVHYRGSAESLAGGIEGQKLRLVQNKDYWVISRD